MLMLILTLALAPMIKMMGGPSSAQGNSARVVGTQSKEVLLANTLIEQALANNYSSFNCGGSFNPASFPATSVSSSFPSNSRCSTTAYTQQPLYYQWTVRNAAQANSLMPTGDQYYNAVLNIYAGSSGGNPILSLPTSFFYNASGATTPQTKTGIVVIQDISGSMMWGQNDYDTVNSTGDSIPFGAVVAPPYLRYRYSDPAWGYNPPASIALAYASGGNAHNDQLDVFSAKTADDPTTPWNDMYLGTGILGTPNCSLNNAWNSANWQGSQLYSQNINSLGGAWNFNYGNGQMYQSQPTIQNTLINICNRSPDWNTMMNNNVARIEAARGSLLNFVVSMEADPNLYNNTRLGFETFSSPNSGADNDPSGQGYDVRVALESIDANNRFANMRRQISWMNREGPGQINAFNGTNYTAPINKAEQMLLNDPTLMNRFILLVSDGAPNGPGDTHSQLAALATQIGNGTYPGANGKTTTMFTLGLMSDDPQMPQFLQTDLAQNTPAGQYFQANNVGDVSPIFDQIKYQIQKVILLNQTTRYNVNF